MVQIWVVDWVDFQNVDEDDIFLSFGEEHSPSLSSLNKKAQRRRLNRSK